MTAALTKEEVRAALVDAFTNGRKRMLKPTVLPVVDRRRPPPPPDLHVEDLELCSEPDHPHGQGWVPVRIMWHAPTPPTNANTIPATTASAAGQAARPPPAAPAGVAAALAATMATTHTSVRAAFQMSLLEARVGSAHSTPLHPGASTHTTHAPGSSAVLSITPGHSLPLSPAPDSQLNNNISPDPGMLSTIPLEAGTDGVTTPPGEQHNTHRPPSSQDQVDEHHSYDINDVTHGGGAVRMPDPMADPSPSPPPEDLGASPLGALLTDQYEEVVEVVEEQLIEVPESEQLAVVPNDSWQLTQEELDKLAYEAKALAQKRAADSMYARLNHGPTTSSGGGAACAPRPAEWNEPGSTGDGTHHAADTNEKKPVVILLHSTGSNMNRLYTEQEAAARVGYLAVTIDCRYHGERCTVEEEGQDKREVYQQALVRAWREGGERPFLLDNLWDLSHLLDYLVTRVDVDASRIGITGVSLGGMHSWLLAVADERIAVTAPLIALQGFKWAIDNEQWDGRVGSIPKLFAAAASDLGKDEVDSEVVTAVWEKLMPGLLDKYDSLMSLPTLLPRPFLAANGELDPRCPMEGALEAFRTTQSIYYEFAKAHQPATPTLDQLLGLSQEPLNDPLTTELSTTSSDPSQANLNTHPVEAHVPSEPTSPQPAPVAAPSNAVGSSAGPVVGGGRAGGVEEESAIADLQRLQGGDVSTALSYGGVVPPLKGVTSVSEVGPVEASTVEVVGGPREEDRAAVRTAVGLAEQAVARVDKAAHHAAHVSRGAATIAGSGASARSATVRAAAAAAAAAARVAADKAAEVKHLAALAAKVADAAPGVPAVVTAPVGADGVVEDVGAVGDVGAGPVVAEVSGPVASSLVLGGEVSAASVLSSLGSPPRVAQDGLKQPPQPPQQQQQQQGATDGVVVWVTTVERYAAKAVAAADEAELAVQAAREAAEVALGAAEKAEQVAWVNQRLVLYSEPGAGHEEKAGMWKAVRAFLDLHLRGVGRSSVYMAAVNKHTFPVLVE